jgi:hypothetical protein
MTKRKTVLGIVLLSALLVAGGYYLLLMPVHPPVPAWEDVWIPENVIVLDSAQVAGSPKAYLFEYDTGAFGYSIKMVSLYEPSHHRPGLLLSSDHITHVWWSSPDTLIVQLDADEYVSSPPPRGIVLVRMVAAQDGR